MDNNTEKANFGFSFNLDFNSTFENKSFHLYLIKIDIIPHFDLLNNPAICCSKYGGSICDDFYYENENKIKKDNLQISSLLKDHSEFYKDYFFDKNLENFYLKNSSYINTNPDNNLILNTTYILENNRLTVNEVNAL